MEDMHEIDRQYMESALELAHAAALSGEVPVGAVVIGLDGQVLGKGGNSPIALKDPSAHAEIMALRQAGRNLGNYRLSGCTIYVTLEPCLMCAGAMIHARIRRLVFGADDPKTGAVQSTYQIGRDGRLNHTLEITGGVLADESAKLLREFFRNKRVSQKT